MSQPTHTFNSTDFTVRQGFGQPSYSPRGSYGSAAWPERVIASDLSKPAEFLLKSLSGVANTFALTSRISRESLYAQYRLKLRSYDYKFAPFLLTTVPPILALVPIYLAFQAVRAIRNTL